MTIHVAHPGSQDLQITVGTLEEGVRVGGRFARPASSCRSDRITSHVTSEFCKGLCDWNVVRRD